MEEDERQGSRECLWSASKLARSLQVCSVPPSAIDPPAASSFVPRVPFNDTGAATILRTSDGVDFHVYRQPESERVVPAALTGRAIALGPAAVNLRSAANFAILAKSGVSTVPKSVINGPVGVSPIAAVALTGLSLTLDLTGQLLPSVKSSGSSLPYRTPSPRRLSSIVAIGDMQTAFNDASRRVNPNFNNFASVPRIYKWSSAISIGSDITIVGGATDTWIFQVSGTRPIAASKRMVLVGGALAKNIVWVVSGAVTSGAGSHIAGVIAGSSPRLSLRFNSQ
ncbi:hypothetical protein B0H19DRAFT_1065539 [Mycena capillaripes]|nr:hypothetical protein B0H19DRAFT_1065539 [Mycena capillaripes]